MRIDIWVKRCDIHVAWFNILNSGFHKNCVIFFFSPLACINQVYRYLQDITRKLQQMTISISVLRLLAIIKWSNLQIIFDMSFHEINNFPFLRPQIYNCTFFNQFWRKKQFVIKKLGISRYPLFVFHSRST